MTAPAWSVIVPTYNRPRQLAACLAAMNRIDPPNGGFEIVLVNDGGATPDVAPPMLTQTGTPTQTQAQYGAPIRLLHQPNAGAAAARNHGAREARGAWLAFTDDDCAPEPGWLRALERALANRPDALAGGVVINDVTDSIFSEASQRLVTFVAGWFDGTERERFFTSNNIAVARDPFHDAGGFDATFGTAAGEDREFCDRWSAQRRPSLTVADAVVRHAHQLGAASFLRQHYGYGRGAALFRRRRGAAGRPVRIDAGFYLASLRHAGNVRPHVRGIALAACTAAAHAAYLAGLARQQLGVRVARNADDV